MYENTTIGVVVPAYDEAPFVRDVIESVPTFVDRVYAVDDCSTDDTFAEMRRAAETWADRDDGPTVHTIRHDENRGVGGAIKTGYERALEEETGVTVVAAGDGQMDLDIVDRLVRPVVDGEADYVKGNRFLSTEDIDEMPPLRRVGNRMLEALTWVASGYWSAGDPQNGYTAISLSALEAIDVVDLYEDYGYCNELLINLNVIRTRIVDIPTDVRYSDEESHIQYSSYIPKVSLLLLRGFMWRLKAKYLIVDFHPLVFFYLFGAGMIGLSVLNGTYTLWEIVVTESSVLFNTLLSTVLLVTGCLFLLLAMVFDRQENNSLVRSQQMDSSKT